MFQNTGDLQGLCTDIDLFPKLGELDGVHCNPHGVHGLHLGAQTWELAVQAQEMVTVSVR